MRIESLTVALRPRTPWEAVELGSALVRRHAGAIWRPWLALTLPVLVLVNLLAWSIDTIWLAGLVMWWLKPVFDRVPMYVLSHAVFGDVPDTRRTLRAQRQWGVRWMPAYLTWRRLGPVRSLYLPVDMLEGGRGDDARQRRRALGAPVYGVGLMLTMMFAAFELVILLGALSLAMLFVPPEYLDDTARWAWNTLSSQPDWLELTFNALAWLAVTMLEPFYVGAGFGLYLNRRTEIEGWDIEIVLRRLRARLGAALAPVLLLAVFAAMPMAARAQDAPGDDIADTRLKENADVGDTKKSDAKPQATLPRVFGKLDDDRSLRDAVKQAYADPSLSPKRKTATWKPRDPAKPKQDKPLDYSGLRWLGEVVSFIGKFGLWLLFGALVLLLVLTSRHWLPWLRDGVAREAREPDAVRHGPAGEAPGALPDDIPSAVRRLWQAQRERDALALLYRASVESMATRAQVALVPGATEAECLRAARKLPQAADREAFAQAVRTWQYAAYAHGLPSSEDFESLLATLAQRFGWTARPGVAGSPA